MVHWMYFCRDGTRQAPIPRAGRGTVDRTYSNDARARSLATTYVDDRGGQTRIDLLPRYRIKRQNNRGAL